MYIFTQSNKYIDEKAEYKQCMYLYVQCRWIYTMWLSILTYSDGCWMLKMSYNIYCISIL